MYNDQILASIYHFMHGYCEDFTIISVLDFMCVIFLSNPIDIFALTFCLHGLCVEWFLHLANIPCPLCTCAPVTKMESHSENFSINQLANVNETPRVETSIDLLVWPGYIHHRGPPQNGRVDCQRN